MRLLLDLGYTNVRLYREGLADWTEAGGPIAAQAPAAQGEPVAPAADRFGPQAVSARRSRALAQTFDGRQRWGNALLDLIERRSTSQVFLIWLAMILWFAMFYWIAGAMRYPGLFENDSALTGGLHGLVTSIYFSFVTATSVGYGDVRPAGILRAFAIAESVSGLLIFGAVVAKFVSRRQDELVREIHRVTFEERLDRVQTNLHLVLSELQAIGSTCDAGNIQAARVAARLESATLIFASELRAIHELLYNPQHAPPEPTLGAILASLASALRTLGELKGCLPRDFQHTPAFDGAVRTISSLAEDICAECVPQVYAPSLGLWMDQVQALAREMAAIE